MRAVMTERQIREWVAVYRVDPWGEHRADVRTGIVACTMASVHTAKGKPRPKVIDFLAVPPKRDKQSVQEMSARMHQFANMHNAFLKQQRKQ